MKLHKKLLLFGASALLLAACGNDSGDTVVEKNDDEPDTEEVSDADNDEVEEEGNDSKPGSRSNPVSLGDTATQDFIFYSEDHDEEFEGNRSITLSDFKRGEEVYDYLMDANPYNEEAPEGMEWASVDVEYKFNEANTDDESNYVMPDFVVIDSEGSQVSQDEVYPTLDDGDEFGYSEIYAGGNTKGKFVFYIPEEDDDVLLKYDDYLGKSIFFNLK